MKVREKAWEICNGIFLHHDYSNLSLRKLREQFSESDQAFLTQLVYGVIQNDLYLNYLWGQYVERKPEKKTAVLLSLATYELVILKKEDYAVLYEYGEIIKSYKKGNFAGFFNAVLRKLSQTKDYSVHIEKEEERLSVEKSIPLWILRLWKAHYGWEMTVAICEDINKEKRQTLRVNTLKTSVEEILKDEKFEWIDHEAVIYHGNYIRSDTFKNGLVFAQDYSSQAVGHFCDFKENDRVLDLCAAPGTKTLHTSALLNNSGEIVAVDLYESRVNLIKEAAIVSGSKNITALTADAREIDRLLQPASFDKVCVDAPCSGLGVLRHKPDIKLSLKAEDLDDLIQLQKEILDKAAQMCKVNGNLIYSTCTLNKKENEKQIENFLKEHDNYKKTDEITRFPTENDQDGFYMVKLERVR